MWSAVKWFRSGNKKCDRDFRFNSRLYEVSKRIAGEKSRGKVMSVEARRKMSLAKKGKPATPKQRLANSLSHKGKVKSAEHLKKIADANRGKTLSEETKRKLSLAHIGRFCGENHPFYGHHHTQESNEKNRIAHLGKKHSEETKRKRALSCTGLLWFNNGVEETKARECPKGFVKGRLNKWFNNGVVEIKAIECPEGFVKGRLKNENRKFETIRQEHN